MASSSSPEPGDGRSMGLRELLSVSSSNSALSIPGQPETFLPISDLESPLLSAVHDKLSEHLTILESDVSQEFDTFVASDVSQKVTSQVKLVFLKAVLQKLDSVRCGLDLNPEAYPKADEVREVDQAVHDGWHVPAEAMREKLPQKKPRAVSLDKHLWFSAFSSSFLPTPSAPSTSSDDHLRVIDAIVRLAANAQRGVEVIDMLLQVALAIQWCMAKDQDGRNELMRLVLPLYMSDQIDDVPDSAVRQSVHRVCGHDRQAVGLLLKRLNCGGNLRESASPIEMLRPLGCALAYGPTILTKLKSGAKVSLHDMVIEIIVPDYRPSLLQAQLDLRLWKAIFSLIDTSGKFAQHWWAIERWVRGVSTEILRSPWGVHTKIGYENSDGCRFTQRLSSSRALETTQSPAPVPVEGLLPPSAFGEPQGEPQGDPAEAGEGAGEDLGPVSRVIPGPRSSADGEFGDDQERQPHDGSRITSGCVGEEMLLSTLGAEGVTGSTSSTELNLPPKISPPSVAAISPPSVHHVFGDLPPPRPDPPAAEPVPPESAGQPRADSGGSPGEPNERRGEVGDGSNPPGLFQLLDAGSSSGMHPMGSPLTPGSSRAHTPQNEGPGYDDELPKTVMGMRVLGDPGPLHAEDDTEEDSETQEVGKLGSAETFSARPRKTPLPPRFADESGEEEEDSAAESEDQELQDFGESVVPQSDLPPQVQPGKRPASPLVLPPAKKKRTGRPKKSLDPAPAKALSAAFWPERPVLDWKTRREPKLDLDGLEEVKPAPAQVKIVTETIQLHWPVLGPRGEITREGTERTSLPLTEEATFEVRVSRETRADFEIGKALAALSTPGRTRKWTPSTAPDRSPVYMSPSEWDQLKKESPAEASSATYTGLEGYEVPTEERVPSPETAYSGETVRAALLAPSPTTLKRLLGLLSLALDTERPVVDLTSRKRRTRKEPEGTKMYSWPRGYCSVAAAPFGLILVTL
ncbi:hypothetical protein SISNIDRAFT_469455 [Sistotremastrum niveocremeum HHB9708]|uniref:Uncharacterized protein n=1 Tax=Sistotremastrum niveocremeum HHB9708 TaxID=1314777 RepID=A0A164PZ28_9AGAM|nr:hypothetical protein SISNIDRAFT_469455 [Sistotremastrum niveocremeum HHB9708]